MDLIEKLLCYEVKKGRSPSIQYALFNKDRIIKRYTYGYADIIHKKEADQYNTYNAFSVTKTFTALAILQLAEVNKLSIDDAIKKYLPDLPYGPDITIKQVLSHSSGIPNPIPLSWIHLPDDKSFDRDEFFKGILAANNRIRSRPNEKYFYSNLGYVLLGQIIEKVSGIKYEEYIRINIIAKLGISGDEMGFEIYDFSKHARGYHKRLSFSNLILGVFINKSKFMDKPELDWNPFKPFYVNGASYGGLIGTAGSFIKYLQGLLDPDCQIITGDYKKMLFTENFTSNNKPTGMCLSWFKGRIDGNNYFTHAGGGGGYYCEIRIYPEIGTGSAIFFNRSGMSDLRFLDKIDRIYLRNSPWTILGNPALKEMKIRTL